MHILNPAGVLLAGIVDDAFFLVHCPGAVLPGERVVGNLLQVLCSHQIVERLRRLLLVESVLRN